MNIMKCKEVINKQGELIEADFYGLEEVNIENVKDIWEEV